MAKKKKLGRPAGSTKRAVNIYMQEERAEKLKDLSAVEQKTQSILVENALEKMYGI